MKKLVFIRRASQSVFAILFIYILWSTTHPLKGLLPPSTFFKINPLIMIVASISERAAMPGLYVSIAMLVLALVLGRFFCGWICPLGAAIDLAGSFSKRSPDRGDAANRKMARPKFFILGFVTALGISGVQLAWALDPMVIMARFVSLNLIPFVTLFLNYIFIFMIKYLHLYGPVQDIYRSLKSSILGINIYYFSHSLVILAFFTLVILSTILVKRFWCRAICPLGAIYTLLANFAPLKRRVEECSKCLRCKSVCRTGAIRDDLSYNQGECVLCMDCIYDCPQHVTSFSFHAAKKESASGAESAKNASGISRGQFLFLLLSSVTLLGFKWNKRGATGRLELIRPPAALKEEEFLNRCVRCGNCMKVCVTNGLQPVMLQAGPSGIWTPQLVPEIGYCEYQCTLCGRTCPTGAIPPLTVEKKRKVRLGLAQIDRSLCIPWANGKDCIVCQEHCPVAEKAIKLTWDGPGGGGGPAKPCIDEELCIGCGICQNKCPTRPVRAVRVFARNSYRPTA